MRVSCTAPIVRIVMTSSGARMPKQNYGDCRKLARNLSLKLFPIEREMQNHNRFQISYRASDMAENSILMVRCLAT